MSRYNRRELLDSFDYRIAPSDRKPEPTPEEVAAAARRPYPQTLRLAEKTIYINT